VPRRERLVIVLTIYSRPGCHLCDEMKAVVEHTVRATAAAARIEEIDITGDPQLEARYGLDIPVLLVNGRKAAKYRIGEEQLRRRLKDEAQDRG
jgi:thiol-disulfide isomerase/thioredoxin